MKLSLCFFIIRYLRGKIKRCNIYFTIFLSYESTLFQNVLNKSIHISIGWFVLKILNLTYPESKNALLLIITLLIKILSAYDQTLIKMTKGKQQILKWEH